MESPQRITKARLEDRVTPRLSVASETGIQATSEEGTRPHVAGHDPLVLHSLDVEVRRSNTRKLGRPTSIRVGTSPKLVLTAGTCAFVLVSTAARVPIESRDSITLALAHEVSSATWAKEHDVTCCAPRLNRFRGELPRRSRLRVPRLMSGSESRARSRMLVLSKVRSCGPERLGYG